MSSFNRSRLFTAGIFCSLFPALCLSQVDTLTLEQALKITLQENIAVTNAALTIDASERDLEALKTRRYPNIETRGGLTRNQDSQDFIFQEGVLGEYEGIGGLPSQDIPIASRDQNSGFFSLDISQPLSQQHRIALGLKQSAVKTHLAEQQLRLKRSHLSRLVKRDYYDILQTQSQLISIRSSIKFYTALQHLLVNLVDQKIALGYELLEVEARLARRRAEEQHELNRTVTLKQQMNKYLNRELNTNFSVSAISTTTLPDLPIPETEALELALSQKPELEVSRLQVSNARLGYDIKKSEYVPDIDLKLRYSQLYGTDFIPDGEVYIGIHAKWEIFDWGRKRKELDSNALSVQKAVNNLIARKQQTRIAISQNYAAITQSRQTLEASRLANVAATEKLRVLKSQYDQQAVLLKDVLDAESDLSRASTEHNRAQLGVWSAEADLQQALGEI